MFAKKVTDTRNYFTHYSPGLKNRAARGGGLLWLKMKMEKLLEVCFLRELGFDLEFIRGKLTNWQVEQLREKGSC
ncbi:MAG: hypothetical protein FJ290_07425 [Planctomycetes bacterium]|nr:hypothetical protein [Planctomycetota bacterium]